MAQRGETSSGKVWPFALDLFQLDAYSEKARDGRGVRLEGGENGEGAW